MEGAGVSGAQAGAWQRARPRVGTTSFSLTRTFCQSQGTQRGLSSERMSKVPRATQLEAGQLGYVLFLLKNSIFIFRFWVRMRLQIYF